MRILKVIHGYPPLYNAGSEVYSQTLCAALCRMHDVHVFTREENPFAVDGSLRKEKDILSPEVCLHVVNTTRVGINYTNRRIDQAFVQVVEKVNPDIVHIGHLNHLSLGIVKELSKMRIPMVYTLHDFWLMCLRGQFVQVTPDNGTVLPLCDGQEDEKCASRCLRRYAASDFSNIDDWRRWVTDRMGFVRQIIELVDIFIAPAKSLAQRFREDFPLLGQKIVYLDYGFDKSRLSGRQRIVAQKFIFGYIGTHIPSKGIHHLLEAFCQVASARDGCELHIWGRHTNDTKYLKLQALSMPIDVRNRIKWKGEYDNTEIVREVFNNIDTVIVPSIWHENSPLVIHEAQQARVPIITADMGGMAEYVRHEENGLLFKARKPEDLARQMFRFVDNPDYARTLGGRGYLYSKNGDVPDITEHVQSIEGLYLKAINNRHKARLNPMPAPWRITFDTNPDHCNYHCTMCEEHSPYSLLQFHRRASSKAKRVMPFDIIARNVKNMAKHGLREIIPSTMGEPLLYKQFEDIIFLCYQTGVMLNLTTNGSFPRLGAEKWSRLLVPVTSDIKISWNGASKETHEAIMKNSNWENMLSNIRMLISVRDEHAASGKNRCRITLQMTFMESNFMELPELIRLAASLGVDRIKGHHLWVHFSELKGEDMRRNSDSICRWNDIVDRAYSASAAYLLPNGKQVLLENIDYIATESHQGTLGQCPFLGKEAWISAVGRFDPCCAPDAERRTLGEFGDLHESDLLEIWNSESYRTLVKTYSTRSVCLKCNMRKNA